MLKVDGRDVPEGYRIVLQGELDVETAPQLKEVVGEVAANILEIDLSGVSFVDSTGLKSLLDISNQWEQRGGRVSVLNPQPEVAEVMQLVGLDRLLSMNNGMSNELDLRRKTR
ncbi:MAG: STAS domain-containing protein [Clostridia bacterium]|nr:STAS domain-containing protein [Clostridia bacterium]